MHLHSEWQVLEWETSWANMFVNCEPLIRAPSPPSFTQPSACPHQEHRANQFWGQNEHLRLKISKATYKCTTYIQKGHSMSLFLTSLLLWKSTMILLWTERVILFLEECPLKHPTGGDLRQKHPKTSHKGVWTATIVRRASNVKPATLRNTLATAMWLYT